MLGTQYHTILLAQIFGLYLLITAIIYLSRATFYRELVTYMNAKSGVVFVSSIVGLILGLLLVSIHNIWIWSPRVVVTILCWAVLLRAVLWLALPEKMVETTKKIAAGRGFYVAILVMAIIGVYELAMGFYLFL